MDTPLARTAQQLMADHKGLLAMDESNPTCNKRFAALGIPQTTEMHRAYRELIVTTPGLGDSVSGAILFDETIRQTLTDGTPFAAALTKAGIIPGIKVDAGAKPLPLFDGEQITEGLDGLPARVAEYVKLGAKFAKWRAVITIGKSKAGQPLPTDGCIAANADALARYAAVCQAGGLVPIVEPEVLMDGDHTLADCFAATERTLTIVFARLRLANVRFEEMLLKPNMVLPGKTCPDPSNTEAIADATVTCLLRTVPAAVAGIAFLSGGQDSIAATQRLNAMNQRFAGKMPWPLTFSFSRAIQQPALDKWHGDAKNVPAAQKLLAHRAGCNRAARQGKYDASVEAAV